MYQELFHLRNIDLFLETGGGRRLDVAVRYGIENRAKEWADKNGFLDKDALVNVFQDEDARNLFVSEVETDFEHKDIIREQRRFAT